jgi:thymidylate kinase
LREATQLDAIIAHFAAREKVITINGNQPIAQVQQEVEERLVRLLPQDVFSR